MSTDRITFSFGQNWSDFVRHVSEDDVSLAMQDIGAWLGADGVAGKRVIDVGSGSGIHSLSFCRLGAKTVHSFDYDPFSVEATAKLREDAGSPPNWTVERGSVLNSEYIRALGTYDVVYSWGVLHHTGAIWDALGNCAELVAPDGVLWISLYAKGPLYQSDLALKRRYNAASDIGKRWMVSRRIVRRMLSRVKHGKNPLGWNEKVGRGMNIYHDIIDWLGGLPYETASEDEVVRFLRPRQLVLERIKVAPERDCSKYVFSRPMQSGAGCASTAG